jgi:hypothetical protein
MPVWYLVAIVQLILAYCFTSLIGRVFAGCSRAWILCAAGGWDAGQPGLLSLADVGSTMAPIAAANPTKPDSQVRLLDFVLELRWGEQPTSLSLLGLSLLGAVGSKSSAFRRFLDIAGLRFFGCSGA